jgi:multiple antibiotic resistance protein
MLLETAFVAFTTLFATVAPLDCAIMYAAITADTPAKQRRSMAVKGVLIASIILIIFAFIGSPLLSMLGISLAALRASGGILLLLIGIDMVFIRSGSMSTSAEQEKEAESKPDISVFPLATPLIAGPGALGAAMLLMANTDGHLVAQLMVSGALLLVMLLTLLALMAATKIQTILGITGMQVVSRVFGVLLTALAVQFIFDGIAQSGLLGIQ